MISLRSFAFFVISALALAACSQSQADSTSILTEGYTFRPVEDIIDADLEVTNFADDGSATLPIFTSVPVACTVVYGTTPEFGSLTLDQDMAGGAHSDHNPLLSDLEPETKYYFRVQGVDDDGNIYLSEVMTFTTPPRDSSQVETENLASPENGAEIIGYSSAFGGAGLDDRWGAASAFDDNPNTEWSSAGDGNDAWIEVQLAQKARIERVDFQSRAMSDGTAITLAFTVTSDSGEMFGPFELPDALGSYSFDVDVEAKSLRIDLIDTSGGNTGVVDLVVYGEFIDG